MLKKWIEEIRNHPDLYKTDSWKYHISGNVIEISVLPTHLKNKQTYRCAVIAVGQVMKALSCCIEKRKSNFHIQTFPTLENPGVVASIRMDENSEFVRNSKPANNQSLNNSNPESILQTLASQYQLNIEKIQDSNQLKVVDVNTSEFNVWLGLYSISNNPFTWLNIGYWKESVLKDCYEKLLPHEVKVVDFCDDAHGEQLDQLTAGTRYLQSIIGLDAKVTAG